MRVLVIGASRGIGLETLQALKNGGHSAVGFSRTRPSAASSSTPAVESVIGDARDGVAVDRALEGVDAVILSLGISPSELFKPVSLFSEATKVVLEGMRQRGIRRLVAVTGFGAGRSRKAIPLWQKLPFEILFGQAYRDKDLQEELIMHSGLDWTIVRPGVLTTGPFTGEYRVLAEPTQWRNGMVSRKDVAALLALQVNDRSLIGRDIVIIK